MWSDCGILHVRKLSRKRDRKGAVPSAVRGCPFEKPRTRAPSAAPLRSASSVFSLLDRGPVPPSLGTSEYFRASYAVGSLGTAHGLAAKTVAREDATTAELIVAMRGGSDERTAADHALAARDGADKTMAVEIQEVLDLRGSDTACLLALGAERPVQPSATAPAQIALRTSTSGSAARRSLSAGLLEEVGGGGVVVQEPG